MKWNLKKIKVSELKEFEHNPRILNKKGLADLKKSITKFGIAEPLIVNTDMVICGGHGRLKVLKDIGIEEVDCYIPDVQLNEDEFKELNIRLNKNIAGEFNFDILNNFFDRDNLIEYGFDKTEFTDPLNYEDLIGKKKDALPILKLTFETIKELEEFQIDIKDLLGNKYKDVILSISAGEL